MTKLEWCRLNAPECLKGFTDEDILECMHSSYLKFGKEVCEPELNFIDLIWSDYKSLQYVEDKRKLQVSSLFGTGLCEPNDGVEFCFVPTVKMQSMEKELHHLYNSLKVTDHRISLCNEVFYTSKIEGANTTLKRTQELHDGEYVNISNAFSENMIKAGFNATKYLNLVSNKLDREILLNVWRILVEDCCCNQDIRGDDFRTGHVQVGGHVGLNHTLLDEAMSNWLEFYNNNSLEDFPFIKAALLHFSFEFIHPFCDGNGRLGRLLMSNFLIKEGFDKIKAVSFSRSIEKERLQYDYAFAVSENVYTDCTFFIEYILERMLDAFKDCLN